MAHSTFEGDSDFDDSVAGHPSTHSALVPVDLRCLGSAIVHLYSDPVVVPVVVAAAVVVAAVVVACPLRSSHFDDFGISRALNSMSAPLALVMDRF